MKHIITSASAIGIAATALGYWYSVAEDRQRRWLEQVTPLVPMPIIPGHEWHTALRWGLIGGLVGLTVGYAVSRRPAVHRAPSNA